MPVNTKVLASILFGSAALSAGQTLAYTQESSVAFANAATGSVSDTLTPSTATNSNLATVSLNLAKFDTGTGVLVGVALKLDSTIAYNTSIAANGIGGSNSNANASRTASGSGSVNLSASAAGATASSSTSLGASCTGKSSNTVCTGPIVTPGTANSVGNGTSSDLSSYVGAGTVSASLSGSLSATAENPASGNVYGNVTFGVGLTDWDGKVTLTYSYLAHANGSFGDTDSLVIDFGDVAEDSIVAPVAFAITNLGAASETAGLDLDSISGSGDTSVLTTDLAGFTNLGVGGLANFLALIDTAEAGTYEAEYLLTLSDANGIGVGQADNYLTLTLRGHVIAAPPVRPLQASADVPEPTTLAVLAFSLFGVVLARRRRAG
jgi:hypothetical protein